MNGIFGSLLSDLRARGVQLQAEGDHLVVEAPAGTLTETDRAALKATKPEILRALELEKQFLGMSLEEFEQADFAVEVRVPWLEVTLWWVPRAEHVEEMVRAGVERGRLYAARDLTNLTRLAQHPQSRADIERIARLKLAFGATIVTVADEPEVGPASTQRSEATASCCACRGTRFWRSIHGATVCGTCHPTADASLVAESIDATGDAP